MSVIILYSALLAILYLALTYRTIILRGQFRVTLGDGGHPALQRAIRAHANFNEYVPLSLALLFLLANIGTSNSFLHGLGAALLVGRLLHALGVSRVREPLPLRMAGMVLTTGVLAVAAVLLLLALR